MTRALSLLLVPLLSACGGPDSEVSVTEEATLLADSSGFELVSEAELASARQVTGRSLRAVLGAPALLFNDGKVYRIPDIQRLGIPELRDDGYRGTEELERDDGMGSSSRSIIIDADNRTPITSNMTSAPQRRIGRLTMGHQLAGVFTSFGTCTGTMVGPRHVLTSGHCFGALTNAVRFQPAFLPTASPATFPQQSSTTFAVFGSGDTDDMALVILPNTATVNSIGFIGLRAASTSLEDTPITVRGYPGSSQWCWTAPASSFPACGGFMYRSGCNLNVVDEELEYECDTTGGMSGSGVLSNQTGATRVIGVHKGEDDDLFDEENRAVRLTNLKVAMLCGTMLNFPATTSFTCL